MYPGTSESSERGTATVVTDGNHRGSDGAWGSERLGGPAVGLADRIASGVHSQRPSRIGVAYPAASPAACHRVEGAGVAARLTDLAVAAAFAGGLGVGVGCELDGFVARATELLGGEAGGHGIDDVLLVAQALAGGVAEVGEELAIAK